MAKAKRSDPKADALARQGALNRRAHAVRAPRFQGNGFFDPRDLVQVKYEMLRRVRIEGHSVSQSATEFGFSRPSYYHAQEAFEQFGLAGLVPRKRGPQGAHKLTGKVLESVLEAKDADPTLSAADLVRLLEERFSLSVHPRSIERGLARARKKAR